MRIAILLGVSSYHDPQDNLAACEQDLAIMQKLLEISGQYEDIFVISGNDRVAVKVKSDLTEWIETYQDKEIEEVFFYYTGHGEYLDNEFYFQLHDFNHNRRRQTSLTNSELDDWLRSLKPFLTVKVIDACYSGVSYIKSDSRSDTIEKYFSSTKEEFTKCIFMFSSTIDQVSFQDHQLSYFTREFITAVKEHKTAAIRYRDIMDYIADKFENNSEWAMTPVFVTQTTNTEIFCNLNSEIELLEIPLASSPAEVDISLSISQYDEESLNLKQIVELEARKYASKERAFEFLENLRIILEKHDLSPELKGLYDLETATLSSVSDLPLRLTIGQWLQDKDHSYFAKPTYKRVFRIGQLGDIDRIRGERKYELEGFDFTVDLPFKAFCAETKRKYPNLVNFYCCITYLISQAKLRFFYVYTDFQDKNWDESTLNLTAE